MAMLLIERNVLKNLTPVIEQALCYSTLKNDNYQFIQNSEVPTTYFQSALPRLPIPKLEKTLERYLAAQRPLISIDEAYAKTEANVKRFLQSSGRMLHDRLVTDDKRNKHTSYISEPWFDMYLKDRAPLPLNYNPCLVHIDSYKSSSQLIKTTNLVISSLRFLRSLRSNTLKPEIFFLNSRVAESKMFTKIVKSLPPKLAYAYAYFKKAYPLDMAQYDHLFNTTRIPELDKDMIVQDKRGQHILVLRNGHFYTIDVLDRNGEILPASTILTKIKLILDDQREPEPLPLGALTTENRNVWATARHLLLKLGNEKTLRKIDSALFVLALDDQCVKDDDHKLVRNFLHSDGRNRWFDKSFSLIVTKDSVSGINFEHSWGDGVAVLRYFNDIYEDSTHHPQVSDDTPLDTNVNMDSVHHLEVNLDEQMKNIIKSTLHKYNETINSLNINTLRFDGLGKRACKKLFLSSDAVMQLGFQLAYFKLTGKYVATYEACSTAAFKHGRTETVRPCTIATKDFCDSLHIYKKNNIRNLRLKLQSCSFMHTQLTREAAMGQGFDRHLFALKYLAEKLGRPTPSIFGDLAYQAINHNILSTSTLSSPYVYAGGFGPVVQDGYGIAYSINDESLGVMVTNYQDQSTNGSDYIAALRKSYEEILALL